MMNWAEIASFQAALAPHLTAIRAMGEIPTDMHPIMKRVAHEVAAENGIEVADMQGPARARMISIPRQEAYFRIREETGASYPEIGAFFGRDHTTIIAGITAHLDRVSAARALAARFNSKPEGAKT